MRPPSPSAWRPGTLLAALAIAAPLAGCGSSSSGKGADPAQLVPASAVLYAGAVVRPTGSLEARARADGRALTGQPDPYLRLLAALQTPGSPALSFKRDVAPWLGPQAGVFVASQGAQGRAALGGLLSLLQQSILGGSGAAAGFPFAGPAGVQGAIVLDTSNASAASRFLATQAARAGAHPASYRGVTYLASAGGVSFAMVHRFAVIGSEAGVRAVIDTAGGGATLAGGLQYAALQATAPAQSLAHLYLPGAAAGAPGAPSQLLSLLTGGRPAYVSLLPQQGAIALDADTLRSGAAATGTALAFGEGEAARAVAELPGESFVAASLGSGAGQIGAIVAALRSALSLSARPGGEAQSPGLTLKGLLGSALAPIAVMLENKPEARRDFQSWMGAGSLFASGSGLADLKGALVIASRNPAASRAAVAKLGARLRALGDSTGAVAIPGTDAAISARLSGLPIALAIADGRDARGQTKFVIGLGEPSVGAALVPPNTLSGTPSYDAAAAQLGEGIQPALLVQVPTLLSLLEGVGLSEDQTLSGVLPFARALNTVSAGGRSLSGDIERTRLVLGLRG
jgi:hypothetical protein